MTIYAPNKDDKNQKDDGDEAEVVLTPLTTDKEPLETAVIKPRKIGTDVKVFLFFIVFLFIAAGGVSGYFLYKHFHHIHHMKHHSSKYGQKGDEYVGRCGVGIDDEDLYGLVTPSPLKGGSSVKKPINHGVNKTTLKTTEKPHHITQYIQDVSVNIKKQTEKVFVPKLDGTRATILHDFEKSFTAIADLNRRRCFILPLDKKLIAPPKNILDLIYKFAHGYYVPNVRLIRQKYRAVKPPLSNLTPYGQPIAHLCSSFASFKLEKVNLLGRDGHDMIHHGESPKRFGGDGHDMVHHGKSGRYFGRDGHDMIPHGKIPKRFGGDTHDYTKHSRKRNNTDNRSHRARNRRSAESIQLIEATDKHAVFYEIEI